MKKALYYFFVASFPVFFVTPADAQEYKALPAVSGNLLQVDFRVSYFDYEEDLQTPLKSTEKGWIPGGTLYWTRTKPSAPFLKAFMELSYGDLKYEGTTQAGRPVSNSGSTQTLFRAEVNFGYTFAWRKSLISPYTGYGYRFWQRGDSEVVESVAFVREDYYWHYIPVGVRAVVQISEAVLFEPNLGARFVFHGRMKAYLTDIDPNYGGDPEFDLGNKIGWFVELPVRYLLYKKWSVAFTPWYEYSKIGKSPIEGVSYGNSTVFFFEPSSTTHQYGFNIGVGYSF
jgi:hypothetical protein